MTNEETREIKLLDNENGRWILSGGYWRCSKCKEKALLKLDKSKGGCREYNQIKSNVCPNCGAKMIEPQESELENPFNDSRFGG